MKRGTVKEVNGRITIMVDKDGARIKIEDDGAGITFLEINLSAKEFMSLLGRRAMLPCKMKIRGLDKVGTKMMHRVFEFKMPKHSYQNQKDVAKKTIKEICPEGWEPDLYFGSQDSFFSSDCGKESWARVNIRKYVEIEEEKNGKDKI